MLNKGFDAIKNNTAPVVVNSFSAPSVASSAPASSSSGASVGTGAPTFAAAYNAARAATVPATYSAPRDVSNNAPGNAGVQFGAFSSRTTAQTQVNNVKNKLGVNAVIETAPNGMFRVRANNLSESSAQNIRNRATAAGIDSYVFH